MDQRRTTIIVWATLGIGMFGLFGCGTDDENVPAPIAAASGVSSVSSVSSASSASALGGNAAVLVLRGDAIGAYRFGADPDEVVEALTAVLGEPTSDSGWEASNPPELCVGPNVRAVAWNSLHVDFADPGGERQLTGWAVFADAGDPPLPVDGGITFASTWKELQQRLGDAFLLNDAGGDEGIDWEYGKIYGSLSESPFAGAISDTATVTSIYAGGACGV